MTADKRRFDQLAKEDYQEALEQIQGRLEECVGSLIILRAYLESDLAHDSGSIRYALATARDIVQVASESVKNALGYTYPML